MEWTLFLKIKVENSLFFVFFFGCSLADCVNLQLHKTKALSIHNNTLRVEQSVNTLENK